MTTVSTATAKQLHICCTAVAQLLLSKTTANAKINQQRSIRGATVVRSHYTISTVCSADTSKAIQPQACATGPGGQVDIVCRYRM